MPIGCCATVLLCYCIAHATGQGAWDVANFCVMSLDSEVLENHEQELLRHYYDGLAKALG
jgi:hypothetical protein